MTNGGTGYLVGEGFTITGGNGAGAEINITAVNGAGAILYYTVTPGSGYTTAPTGISPLAGTEGLGAAFSFTPAFQPVVSVTTPGSGYTSAPSVSTSAGSISATAVTSTITLQAESTSDIGGSGQITIQAAITGSGSMDKAGSDTLTLSGVSNYTGATTVSDGTLAVTGTETGTSAINVETDTALSVGPTGTLSGGSLALTSGSTFSDIIDGTTAGSEYGQVISSGLVTLGGSTLDLSLGFTASPGASFTLIKNNSGSAVSGAFASYPEGSTVSLNGQNFVITYKGGSGHDVVLYLPGASAPTVSGVVINPGQGAPGSNTYLGNSRVLSIQVNFSQPVDVSSLANAFTLTNVGTAFGGATNNFTLQSAPTTNTAIGIIHVSPSGSSGTTTSATLTFSNYSSTVGSTVEGGSLTDGQWSLSVNGVASNGTPMSSPYTTPAGSAILRLFGDYTGAGVVSSADLGPLGTTFGLLSTNPGFIGAFDSDGNGEIDSTDLGRFGQNFGLTV